MLPSMDLRPAHDARAIGLLLHPHPAMGGDRFHPVVDELYRRLPAFGIDAARFDFSSGELDAAADEVRSALDDVTAHWPGLPVLLVGYSFGAGIALRVDDERVAGWFAIAPPLGMLAATTAGADPRPKHLAVPGRDEYAPPREIVTATASWATTEVTVLDGADHFMAGATVEAADRVVAWAQGLLKPKSA